MVNARNTTPPVPANAVPPPGAARTEVEIALTYLDLMRDTPHRKLKVRDVTDACHISRTAFYRYFDDMEDLLEQIERGLLKRLSLYHSKRMNPGAAEEDALAGKAFASMERWFQVGIDLRGALGPLMGPNGDVYFRIRLLAQIKADLNRMMDDELAPNDQLRPYYIELVAASHIGLLAHVASIEDEGKIISARQLARIANSAREAYYQTAGAPPMDKRELFGE